MRRICERKSASSGCADLILIAVILLISSLLLSSGQQLLQSALLLQNQVHAERALLKAISNASLAVHGHYPPQPGLTLPLCTSASGKAGPVERTLFRCDLIRTASPDRPPLINYQALLENAAVCQRHQHSHVLPQHWSHRSQFECRAAHHQYHRYAGDLFLERELNIEQSSEQLIATRGSLYIRTLRINGPLTIISLGDIFIGTIIQAAPAPVSVMLVAPAGIVSVPAIQGPLYFSIAARADKANPAVPRLPVRASRFLPPLPSLPIGIFPQALGIAP